MLRIALANLPHPESPEAAVEAAVRAIGEAGAAHAAILCFPECFLPGYRKPGSALGPPDPAFLERAWDTAAGAARKAGVAVVLGTERAGGAKPLISAIVIDRDGTVLGFQDKLQIDPSEELTYAAGNGPRHVFRTAGLTFGVSICHEGWRYPETVRQSVRQGAQLVFHPHCHWAEPGGYRPASFADPANTFHEKAILCRAAENTCYFASVNFASDGSPTTSAVAGPDGQVIVWQPYGKPGLLIVDLDLATATGLLASRLKAQQSKKVARSTRQRRSKS